MIKGPAKHGLRCLGLIATGLVAIGIFAAWQQLLWLFIACWVGFAILVLVGLVAGYGEQDWDDGNAGGGSER